MQAGNRNDPVAKRIGVAYLLVNQGQNAAAVELDCFVRCAPTTATLDCRCSLTS